MLKEEEIVISDIFAMDLFVLVVDHNDDHDFTTFLNVLKELDPQRNNGYH